MKLFAPHVDTYNPHMTEYSHLGKLHQANNEFQGKISGKGYSSA